MPNHKNDEIDFVKQILTAPDKSITDLPSLAELKAYWGNIEYNTHQSFLKNEYRSWIEKRNNVSKGDFVLDPLRNKLNVLISRTIHESYHRCSTLLCHSLVRQSNKYSIHLIPSFSFWLQQDLVWLHAEKVVDRIL